MKQINARYLYLKNGDAALQVEAIAALKGQTANGPDGFIADFLDSVLGNPVLFLSILKDSKKHIKIDDVEAKCFPSSIKGLGVLGTLLARAHFLIAGTLKAFRFKPTRIICVRRGGILWMGYLLGQLYRAPVIYVSHDHIKLPAPNPLLKMIYAIDEYCIRNMASCVCQGKFTRDELLSTGVNDNAIHRFDGSYRYIYETAQSYLTQNNSELKREAILYVGRIEKNKGVLDLINACAPILKNNHELRLIYAGVGDASLELHKRSKELNIEDKVTILGKLPYSEIPALMASAKVLVTPTRTPFHEGHRHAIFEGFMCGLPVIAPNFGPYPYYVTHDINGLLYQPDSFDDLATKVQLVVNDNILHKQLSDGARKYGESIVDPETSFGNAIINAFEKTMD